MWQFNLVIDFTQSGEKMNRTGAFDEGLIRFDWNDKGCATLRRGPIEWTRQKFMYSTLS